MDFTTIPTKTSRRAKWSAEQLAAAVADCPSGALPLEAPPLSNRGVERDNLPEQGTKEALVDYVRFVVKEPDLLDWWLDFLGGHRDSWAEKSSGFYGYTRSYWLSNIVIFAEGGGDNGGAMGFCVQMSGLGCREFEASFEERTLKSPFAWSWQHFLRCLTVYKPGEGAFRGTINVTRLDLALDDRAGGLDLQRVKASTLDGHFSCRGGDSITESPCRVQDSHKRGQQRRGLTVEFGRKSSSQMVRIYDKAAEMCSKGAEVVGDWVRAEYQANGERAQLVAQLVALNGFACVPGVMRSYLDFKELGGFALADVRHAPSAPWWSAFLEQWEKVIITLRPLVKTVEKARRWLTNQVEVTLAMVCDASESGKQFLASMVQDGRTRYRPHHQRMIAAERARLATFAPGLPTGF